MSMSKGKILSKSIADMIKEIKQSRGSYEAKRLERAADEVPNLERLYQKDALDQLFRGDNAKGIMTMRPGDFERYAKPLDYQPKEAKRFFFGKPEGFPEGGTEEQYLQYLAKQKFSDVPFLDVNKLQGKKGKSSLVITGHEGRHRNRALDAAGEQAGLVQFLPRSGLREDFPRRYRDEYIDAMREELEKHGRMVTPENDLTPEGAIIRPAIELPDVYQKGGAVRMGKVGIAKSVADMAAELAAKAKKPEVSRIDMNFKDVTKRIPALTEAANLLREGKLTREQYAELVNRVKPVTPYDFVPKPATAEEAIAALTSNKKGQFGKSAEIGAGERADLRLDIPSYSQHGVWVNSIHRKNAPTVYGSTSAVKNAEMIPSADKALKVATGDTAKAPFAVIRGEWNPLDEESTVKRAQEYLRHKDWRQVGYDPERHGYFYDRETMAPILGADEVIQIGPLVLAKKPKYGSDKDFPFKNGGAVRKAEGGAATSNEAMLRRSKRLQRVEKPVSISPLQLARGWAAGTTGLPGDIESIGRMLIPGVSEENVLPTSEEMLKRIPFAADDEVGQRAAEIGTLFGGFGVGTGAKGAMKGAKAIAPKAGELAEQYMMRTGMALPVVPQSKGGAKNIDNYIDPKSSKINNWKWRPLGDVQEELGISEIPEYIQGEFGGLMADQLKKANAGDLSVRDFLKAYGITQSSIGREGRSYSTATKAGLKLPKQDYVRPEGAFAEWLGSKTGQRFLDKAEQGIIDENALKQLKEQFSPFGMSNALTERLRWGINYAAENSDIANKFATSSIPEYRDLMLDIKGIGPAKSGFIGSMLGRGDLPTLDARQVLLHTGKYSSHPDFAKFTRPVVGGKPVAANESVDRLIARQEAMNADIDESLKPFYQHLMHHAVWDKAGGSKTTHEDLVRAMKNYKKGGQVSIDAMRLAVGGMAGGGRSGLIREGIKSVAKPADKADVRSTIPKILPEPKKASKAFEQFLGERIALTAPADRMVAIPGPGSKKGGPLFPWLSTVDPAYENVVWANKGKAAASKMINLQKEFPGVIFTPQIGSAQMHRSNQVVYDDIRKAFNRAVKEGRLTPELRDAYNERLTNQKFYMDDAGLPLFDEGFDVSTSNLFNEGNTFTRRAAIAEVLGGEGVGGKKGRIIDYDKIISKSTEPMLADAPTGSVGPRAFQISGDTSFRPDLHRAFPEMIHGADVGVHYEMTPRELLMHDFVSRIEKAKGRKPGVMDWDRNKVTQEIDRETLQRLEDAGYKKGGQVKLMAEGGQITADDLVVEERKL